jgi:outer membrane murein-binding lipoprotein Lpp
VAPSYVAAEVRAVTTLLAVSTLILASASAYLYQELAAARERTLHEIARVRFLQAEVTHLKNDREETETDLSAARRASTPPPAVIVEPSSVVPSTPTALNTGTPQVPETTLARGLP